MKPIKPIYLVELFPPLNRELLAVLRSLQPEDWDKPTVCAPWTVKDVAAHLLGGNLGRLKSQTGQTAPLDNPGFDELTDLINRSNALWVQAAQRISPEILIEFLDLTDRRLYAYFKSLDQDATASFTVAWASDDLPPNWFDIAREYTEKWLHQQHIREAVGRPLLTERKWLFPVLDTFMRALPRAYRSVEAADGVSVTVQVSGEAGGTWSLAREENRWRLYTGRDPQAACTVTLDQDLAWRLFTKGIGPEDARRKVEMTGDRALGEQALEMVSIMA